MKPFQTLTRRLFGEHAARQVEKEQQFDGHGRARRTGGFSCGAHRLQHENVSSLVSRAGLFPANGS